MSVQRVNLALLKAQRKRPGVRKRFDWADVLLQQIRAMKLPEPVRELRPFTDRRFSLDLAWESRKLFVECDGGEWLKASARRHGGAKDCERWNSLTAAGWTGYRFVGSQIKSGHAIAMLETVFDSEFLRGTR